MARAASPFIRQTDPSALVLTVEPCGTPNHFNIANDWKRLADYDREYVCFGGYFGTHDPHVFAAAPDMLDALERLLQWEGHHVYCGHAKDDSKPCVCGLNAAHESARAAIAKARGQ